MNPTPPTLHATIKLHKPGTPIRAIINWKNPPAYELAKLRRVFGPKRDEVTGEWRKLHNEELHDVYSSPGIFRIIKATKMRWALYVARMGRTGTV
jgi:hypothetical protein